MSILFVSHTAQLGGAELCLVETAAAFPDATVALFAPGPLEARLAERSLRTTVLSGGESLAGVRRDSGLSALLAAPGLGLLAWRLARAARRAELVWANTQKAFATAALAAEAGGPPLVWHLHDILSPAHFSAANIKLAIRLANRRAARVVCNSEATAAAFVAAGGDERRAVVVPNGLDPGPYAAAAPAERGALGVPAGVPLIGMFGRFSPWKGQHVMLEALARLPEAHLLLVGAPLFGEEAYARDLPLMARALGVAERVHWPGFRADVPELMAACDAIAHASVAPEPFGRVIVEGLLAGKPVVAASEGGAAEILDDGRTGRLVPPGDAAALAAALAALLADAATARRLAQAGRAMAVARYASPVVARALRHVADGLLAPSALQRPALAR